MSVLCFQVKNRLGGFATGHLDGSCEQLRGCSAFRVGLRQGSCSPCRESLLSFLMASAYFVCSGEAGPWLVCPSVIVLGICHLHIVTESDKDLSLPEFFHRGPLAELQGREKSGAQSTEDFRPWFHA